MKILVLDPPESGDVSAASLAIVKKIGKILGKGVGCGDHTKRPLVVNVYGGDPDKDPLELLAKGLNVQVVNEVTP